MRVMRETPYLLIIPAFAVFSVTLIFPIFYNVYVSFNEWTIEERIIAKYVGLRNYVNIFSNEPRFYVAVINTFIYTFVTVGLQFIIGLGLALLLNRELRGKRIIRSLILVPYATMPVVTALTWELLFIPDFGLINKILAAVGIYGIGWIAKPSTALLSCMITQIWREIPFATIVLLAGLQSLPVEPFEAATLDGASKVQTFRYLTLPLLRPVVVVILLFQIVFTLRAFDIVWVLTGGGPGDASLLYSILIYKYLFYFWDVGGSSVLALFLFAVTCTICLAFFRALYREMEIK